MSLPKFPDVTGLYESLGRCTPQLSRGLVWCHVCGRQEKVDSAACMRTGRPKCCGQTMSIDSPAERVALAKGGRRS